MHPAVHPSRPSAPRPLRVAAAATAAIVASLLTTAPALARPADHAATTHHTVRIESGTFADPGVVLTNFAYLDESTVAFDASGGTHWEGSLVGDTTYSGTGTVDLTTGRAEMTLHETFTGTVAGFGSGTIDFADHLVSENSFDASAASYVDATVVSAAGDLTGIQGFLHFQTTEFLDPVLLGNGPTVGWYLGVLVR